MLNFPLITSQLSVSIKDSKGPHIDGLVDAMINTLCANLIHEKKSALQDKLYFTEVNTIGEWSKVIDLRLKIYQKTNQYMLNELTSGTDSYDARSSIYAAWIGDVAVATIRLTPFPFETMKYINEEKLMQFLGHDYKETYLEWSRLLVDPDTKNIQIMPALLIYAGMKALTNSHYKRYFGYTKPLVRRLMQKFCIENDMLEFSIPSRNNNKYLLLKGNFLRDFWNLVDKDFSLSTQLE
jgi:hypothetical protein